MEVEKGDNEDGEEERTIDARSVKEVGGRYKQDEVDRRSVRPICSISW